MTCKVSALFYNFARIYPFVHNKVTSFTISTRYVLVKHGCPGSNKVKIWQTYVSPTFWHPGEHGMSVKCEDPIDEPTVQVCYLSSTIGKLKILHFVRGTELPTDRQTYRQTNGLTDGQIDGQTITRCPRRTFHYIGVPNTTTATIFILSTS